LRTQYLTNGLSEFRQIYHLDAVEDTDKLIIRF